MEGSQEYAQRNHCYLDDGYDYNLINLESDFMCRGPMPNEKYFLCIGSAQTFGRYVSEPYPYLLSKKIHLSSLNFGFAGVGPKYHINLPIIEKYIKKAKFVIVQVMSARSEANSLFDCNGENIGIFENRKITPLEFWNHMIQNNINKINDLVKETRENYIDNMKNLLKIIPKNKSILFWFSTRKPKYIESNKSLKQLWEAHPQLVNHNMINKLKELCGKYIECVPERGLPNKIIQSKEKFLSEYYPNHPNANSIQTHNYFYPSQEMHYDAVNTLTPFCDSLLRKL
jgi:hypothetical protein